MTFWLFIFPWEHELRLLYFCLFRKRKWNFIFLGKKRKFYVFLGRQGICPRSYVSFSEIRKWDLRSLLGRKHFVCWVDFIFIYIYIFFERFVLIMWQRVVKVLDLKMTLNFKKIVERITESIGPWSSLE